jgi:hypothetical protein
VMRQSLFAGDERLARDRDLLAVAGARVLPYALAAAGTALVLAVIALIVALLK